MKSTARGFTLLEVLLATTVLAAGLALALATLRAAGVGVERAEVISAREEHIRAVEGFLRQRLTVALPVSFGVDSAGGQALRFVGEPERIAFVADLPPYLGRAGPSLHELALHHADNGRAWLGIGFATVLAGQVVAEIPPRPPEVLVEDVIAFQVRFRSRDLPGQPGGWSERWERVDSLPVQVEISISSAAAGAWPPLVVNLAWGGSVQ